MNNNRMKQLIFMFSSITGKSLVESEQIIKSTATGKAILANDETVLYEQQTENLYCIAQELQESEAYKEVTNSLSNENIVTSLKHLRELELRSQEKLPETKLIYSKTTSPNAAKSSLSEKRKHILKVKQQNKLNIRRIKNADKRQK